jgi:hypothetical protein
MWSASLRLSLQPPPNGGAGHPFSHKPVGEDDELPCWNGKGDIRCDDVPDPTIEHGRNVGAFDLSRLQLTHGF